MDNKIVNTTYVPLQPPYKVIKHIDKIGVQIGTQIVTISGGSPLKIETHNYPVVAAENRITPSHDRNNSFDASSEGEVWDNVETKQVSVLCDAGTQLSWKSFIDILWHDHARLGNCRKKIQKVHIFKKLLMYNKSQELPSPGFYTIHLHTESSGSMPEVVRSANDDIFALNVEWADDPAVLEQNMVSDLMDYLLIISENRMAKLWKMKYETIEERLLPLVERLNANPKATSFRNIMMASFEVRCVPPYEKTGDHDQTVSCDETIKKMEMEESVLDKISANNIRFYYEGWRNGKNGAICQQNGIYRFIEMSRGKAGFLDDVKRNEDDNPIVAVGIVAYWLIFNSKKELVLKRLTQYKNGIPQNIREQFDNYTKEQFTQFKAAHRDDPLTWDWDWEYEFYTKYIIPHEIELNKNSEALFDYISDSDIKLVRDVMKSYIKYLKKCRTDKGYRVIPELLVLRAVDSQDESKYEDLEDYEVNTILEELKDKGYIDAIWVYGQKLPWTIKMLDKGRVYMKKLEEGEIVPPNNEQTSDSPHEDEQALSSSTEADDIISDENIRDWDLFKDWILKDRVIEAIKNIPADEVGGEVKRHFVIHKVLKEIGWLRHKQTTRYVGLMKYYKVVDFAAVDFRDNNLKPFKKIATTEWGNHLTPGTDLGENYRKFANTVRNTFTQNIDGELDDFKKFYTSGKRKYNQVVADNS